MANILRKAAENFRNLAKEAEADEKKIVGRHRASEPITHIIPKKAHNTAKHFVHVVVLAGAGMPAILAFEAARPIWARYVESPIEHTIFGDPNGAVSHAGAYLSTFLAHYL